MDTDQLIRGLAADTTSRRGLGSGLAIALGLGLVAAVALFAATLHPRSDLCDLLLEPRLLLKFAVTLSLAIAAICVVMRLARPGARPGSIALALLVPIAILAIGLGSELALSPADSIVPGMIGRNARYCVWLIPVMSAPILAAALLALRRGAPTRPTLTGAVAGLVAGGLGAALYALHCTDDSPFFLLVWYSIGIGIVTLAGAWLGRRVLVW